MKATGPCKLVWIPEKHAAWIRPNTDDELSFTKVFEAVTKRQQRLNFNVYPIVTINLPQQTRTYKQNDTLWALITIIFESMNGRKPTQSEKYDLYLDILEEYADRVPTRFSQRLRPIHISESDVAHAAKLIQACFDVLVEYCDLDMDQQSDVRKLFYEWHAWRGTLDQDPLDSRENDDDVSESEWWESHKVSDASGVGGYLEKAHIVSRGAAPLAIDKPFNWLALTPSEHREQHQKGWEEFLQKYPHLQGRVERARSMVAQTSNALRNGNSNALRNGDSTALRNNSTRNEEAGQH